MLEDEKINTVRRGYEVFSIMILTVTKTVSSEM
jgi:hypothetical protein